MAADVLVEIVVDVDMDKEPECEYGQSGNTFPCDALRA
jgi:hypothetical protein